MIFETLDDIPDTKITRGETGYGGVVGVGPNEFKYMIKFKVNSVGKSTIVYLPTDTEKLIVIDDTENGMDILENSSI